MTGQESVTCAACGFFAVRHLESQLLVSPGAAQRKSGHPPGGPNAKCAVGTVPFCAVNSEAAHEHGVEYTPPAEFVKIAKSTRECGAFTKWLPGLTPKEHLDMAVLEDQRTWQRKCDTEDKQWRESQDKDNRRWRLIELGVMGGLVTVITLAVQIGIATWGQQPPTAATLEPPPAIALPAPASPTTPLALPAPTPSSTP